MSSAQAILANFAERGITLEATPKGTLRYAPKEKLTADDVARLKAHKQELLKLFSVEKVYASSLSSLPSLAPDKPDRYRENDSDDSRDDGGGIVPASLRAARGRADRLGLVARWSREFGYVSLHDPTTGEWHDLAVEDAPAWAKREAHRRKELRKERGITRMLSATEMEQMFEAQSPPMWEEVTPLQDRKRGLTYDDATPEGE